MEECELCGKQITDVYVINVEGVELRVCMSCAKGKKIVYREEKTLRKSNKKIIEKPKKAELELVDNYGRVVRNAREAMKIPIKVLAEMINEKETMLLRIEQQKMVPDAKLIGKLEKTLNIKLEEEASNDRAGSHGRKEEATLGEFLN